MFTLYDVVRLRPLPYSADDRLYVIQEYRRPAAPQQAATGSSASSYLKWAADAESLAGPAAWSLPRGIFVTIDSHSEVVLRARSGFTLEPDVRAAIAGLGDRVAIAKVESLTHKAAALMAPLRFSARTAAIFAVLAVILSGVGIFAVVSYLSAPRRRELAIRSALGANPLAIT